MASANGEGDAVIKRILSWSFFVGMMIISMPMIAFMWICLVSTVNWHDVLLISVPIVIQYQIYLFRRQDFATERAVSRIRGQAALRAWERSQGTEAEAA